MNVSKKLHVRKMKFNALTKIPVNPLLQQHQIEAIEAVERELSRVQSGGLVISMATGSGKTMTLLNLMYRFIREGLANRIILLSDRRDLSAQNEMALTTLEVEPGRTLADMVPIFRASDGSQQFVDPETSQKLICVATTNWLNKHMPDFREVASKTFPERGERRTTAPRSNLFDLVVFDGGPLPGVDSVTRHSIDFFNAIEIFFTSLPIERLEAEADHYRIAYRYDLATALRDGSLVDSDAARLRPTSKLMQLSDRPMATNRVFLGYAYADSVVAKQMAKRLRMQGVIAVLVGESGPGEDITSRVEVEIESGDVFVPLLSPASSDSTWVQSQLDKILDRRGIEVMPALISPCNIPRKLADRTVVDLTSNVNYLVAALTARERINLRALSVEDFIRLTQDLLGRLHFQLDVPESTRDKGYDFVATYRDALNFADPVQYLVQVKCVRGGSSSVNTLRELAMRARSSGQGLRGLLVTNTQLTSVAQDALNEINENEPQVRVIDGLRFSGFLLQYPDLILRYFPQEGDVDGN